VGAQGSKVSQIREQVLRRAASCPHERCPLNAKLRQFPLQTHGALGSPYVLIGEAPGESSLEAGRPWTGPAGQALRTMFNSACLRHDLTDLQLEDVFFLTDLVRCHPLRPGGGNRAPLAPEWRACAPYLAEELGADEPRVVLVAGYRNAARIKAALDVDTTDFHAVGWQGAGGRIYRFQHPSPINPTSKTLGYRVAVTELFSRVLSDRLDQSAGGQA